MAECGEDKYHLWVRVLRGVPGKYPHSRWSYQDTGMYDLLSNGEPMTLREAQTVRSKFAPETQSRILILADGQVPKRIAEDL